MVEISGNVKKFFEVSWEVCNKVGGIYTVIKSKATAMVKEYGDNYLIVGPYFPNKAHGEFIESVPGNHMKKCFDELSKEGIVCHYGKWLIKSEPQVILIDFSRLVYTKDQIKTELWDKFEIDSLGTQYYDYDEPVVWATAAGKLIEKLAISEGVVAQFHEWLSGAGLLYLKSRNAGVATVFTTHATMLGRTMASTGVDLYDTLDRLDPIKESYNFKVQAKHLTERACAHNADVFTTVSEITSIEAEKILDKKADLVLPNGLDIALFPTFEEAMLKHNQTKTHAKSFIMSFFFPYYSFDIDNTLIFFIAGRYEFGNKGIDIFIEALAELNKRLRARKDSPTIVVLILVPAGVRGTRAEVVEGKSFFDDIDESIEEILPNIRAKMTSEIIARGKFTEASLVPLNFLREIKAKVIRFKKQGQPPLSTHILENEGNDPILNTCLALGLDNSRHTKVKIVFYPIYLTGADGLLDLNYYETMSAGHLGVFPSMYEPWGYTPLEAGALGVPAVTTDTSGFGKYLCSLAGNSIGGGPFRKYVRICSSKAHPGIFILRRFGRSHNQEVVDLANLMFIFTQQSREDRVKNKIEAHRLAAQADWRNMAKFYFEAHKLALKK